MTFDHSAHHLILRCPRSHRELIQDGDSLVSTDPEVRLRYPILEGIPRLIVDEATELSTEEWTLLMQRSGQPTSGN